MSARSYGLFSDEFLHPCNVRVQATGDILAIDRNDDYDLSAVKWLEIDSSFFYLNLLRDSVSLNNFLPNFSFWVDAIMLPAFQMYDDTGTVSTTFPTSVVLGVKYYFIKNRVWNFNLSAMGGMEFIPDYNYMFNPVYGLFGNVSCLIADGWTYGLTLGSPDFRALLLEAGVRYRLAFFDAMASFALDGNYTTFKTGFIFHVSPGFSVLCGGNYTIVYNGWNVTGGIELSQFKLFNVDSRAGLSVVYNLVAGPSFTLSLNLEYDTITPEKQTPRETGTMN